VKFRKHKLDNGLEIVAECNDQAYSTAIGFFVRAGSRDETPEEAGLSHFLEHMTFKGTESRTADDVNRQFDEIGAHSNACTSEESTIFYAHLLPEHQTLTVEILGDILRPSLRAEDFETEKQVILEEISMYEDGPPFGADERVRAIHYGDHPLANSVLGTVDSIEAMTIDRMRDYHTRRYAPSNVVLAAGGRVDFDRLVETVDRVCGEWDAKEAPRLLETPRTTDQRIEIELMPRASQEYVMLLADAPDASASSRYAAQMAGVVLGDESGSRLFWEIVDKGRAEHASLGRYEFDDAGLFMTYLCCEPKKTSGNLKRLAKIFRKAALKGITDRELELSKSKLRSRIVMAGEQPQGRMFAVGGDWLQRHEYLSIRDELNILDAIEQEQVDGVLQQYPLTSGTILAIGPLESLDWPF